MDRKYGWKRSLPDHRDYIYTPPASLMAKALSDSVDLRPLCPIVTDQGNLGSCTAHAIAQLVQFLFRKNNMPYFPVSKLFIYYQERLLEGTVNYDAGAYIRDGMKVVNKQGSPKESLWPYVVKNFKKKPPQAAYTDGLRHKVIEYRRIDNTKINDLKSCLSSGFPIVGGFSVYESFLSTSVSQTGIVPYPAINERMVGGHAIMVVGYNDSTQRFTCQNSWGLDWGDRGFFYMPYAYFVNPNLADDFWTATLVN